jgi:GT2 family glycosyltransferase
LQYFASQAYLLAFSSLNSRGGRISARNLLRRRKQRLERPVVREAVGDIPEIDISILCFNSETWLGKFMDSLLCQDYPTSKINLIFTDNSSTDSTPDLLQDIQVSHQGRFASIHLLTRPNRGFGAGNNAGIRVGRAPLVVVVNPDIEFEQKCLMELVGSAHNSPSEVVCWEPRQKPFEHPKHYDPITREVSWCSHACVMMRRSAVEAVEGYDERIFLYCEDVEFSYRLREAGYHLKYVPSAVVWHYSYSSVEQVKKEQYLGSIVGNFFLRTRYGSSWDVLMILPLLLISLRKSPFPGARISVLRRFISRYLRHAPALLLERNQLRKEIGFPFRVFDYEISRDGAFLPGKKVVSESRKSLPLVSVVTRTVGGRSNLLKQAGLSVLGQTYANIEWVVVEDGGEEERPLVESFQRLYPGRIKYLSMPKVGRAAAGNEGLAASGGEWLMMLDDDDCLYADHVETLVLSLLEKEIYKAAYSLAWEVPSEVQRRGMCVLEGEYRTSSLMRQPFSLDNLKRYNYIPIQAVLFHFSLFRKCGGFDTHLEFLEDWNLWQRYASECSFLFVPKTTSLYRVPLDPKERIRRQKELELYSVRANFYASQTSEPGGDPRVSAS